MRRRVGLSEDALAFYDALEINDSAVRVLGDETLRDIARELVETVRSNTMIDWALRENLRAKLQVLVKHILRKHGYPLDKEKKATRTVLEQAEVLSVGWAALSRIDNGDRRGLQHAIFVGSGVDRLRRDQWGQTRSISIPAKLRKTSQPIHSRRCGKNRSSLTPLIPIESDPH